MDKKLCEMGSAECACYLFRLFFGFWLAYVGLTKWVVFGTAGFHTWLAQEFAKTWVSGALLTFTGWIILIAEPLLGIWLILGIAKKAAWFLTACLLFMLVMGKTIQMDYPTVFCNWIYCLLALAAGACSSSCGGCKGKGS